MIYIIYRIQRYSAKVWEVLAMLNVLPKTARWVTVWRFPLFLAAAIAGNVLGIVRPFVRWAIGKLIRFHLTWGRQSLGAAFVDVLGAQFWLTAELALEWLQANRHGRAWNICTLDAEGPSTTWIYNAWRLCGVCFDPSCRPKCQLDAPEGGSLSEYGLQPNSWTNSSVLYMSCGMVHMLPHPSFWHEQIRSHLETAKVSFLQAAALGCRMTTAYRAAN